VPLRRRAFVGGARPTNARLANESILGRLLGIATPTDKRKNLEGRGGPVAGEDTAEEVAGMQAAKGSMGSRPRGAFRAPPYVNRIAQNFPALEKWNLQPEMQKRAHGELSMSTREQITNLIDRRSMLRGMLCGAAIAGVSMALIPNATEAQSRPPGSRPPGSRPPQSRRRGGQAKRRPPKGRRRRWRCWWSKGRRRCGWR
jgi:hypothetical protein